MPIHPYGIPAIALAAAAVLALNLPFGYWRSRTNRFSLPWFLSVHVPVPLVIFIRFACGLGWHLATFPVLVGAFLTGQYLGGRLRRRHEAGGAGTE